MSFIDKKASFMSWYVGDLSGNQNMYSNSSQLSYPEGVRVNLILNQNYESNLFGDCTKFNCRFTVTDFNRSPSILLQWKAWLQDKSKRKLFLQEKWSEPTTFHPEAREQNFGSAVMKSDLNWSGVEFSVEVRPVFNNLNGIHESMQFSDKLVDAFKSEKFGDITVKVGDRMFKASEYMLCVQSDYFKAMFSNETEEKKSKLITIKDAEPEIVQKLLEFIHTGKVDLKSGAAELLSLANKYQYMDLCHVCTNQLCAEFQVETIVEQLKLVTLYGHLTDFKAKVLQFVKKNKKEISKLRDWKEFGEKNGGILVEILALDD